MSGHDIPTTLSEDAVKPDVLLANSKIYFTDHARERSVYQLEKAIEAIEAIEQDIDAESKIKVDLAIDQLREIIDEIRHENFDVDKLNSASIRALTALTFAELKVTEHFVETHESNKARLALKYGMMHVKNSLMFSTGKKKEYELRIYNEMDSIMENGELTNTEIIQKLEKMIEDLDNLEPSLLTP